MVDRTIKEGKFEFFVQGRINENMTVHYPVLLDMKKYYNPAPSYQALGEEGEVRELIYLYVELDELAIREGRTETKVVESPLVVDAEGDAIIFEFSGLSASCPAISCEGFGESEEVLNQFRCKVNEKLMVPACNGTHKIVVIIMDNSGDA